MEQSEAIKELLYFVGKLAAESGEEWRLQHAELMDAYEALCEIIGEETS